MSSNNDQHRYTLEIRRKDSGTLLGTVPITPDWGPALEWARFSSARRDTRQAPSWAAEGGHIEPVLDARAGGPHLSACRAVIPRGDGAPSLVDIPLEYFRRYARTASSSLVAQGTLAPGEVFQYLVCAYPAQPEPDTGKRPAAARFSTRSAGQPIALEESSLCEFLADSSPYGPEEGDRVPVFIPQDVVREAADLMRQAEAAETGGILIGRLHRDSGRPELFVEVTTQIPARHVRQELTRLTFTPETWAAVDQAVALRRKEEIYVGWWHTHPAAHWCDRCPPEKRRQCKSQGKSSGDFFSLHDEALHRTVFPRAYSIALVLSDGCPTGDSPLVSLYGWDQGIIRSRGFHVLGATPWQAISRTLAHQQG